MLSERARKFAGNCGKSAWNCLYIFVMMTITWVMVIGSGIAVWDDIQVLYNTAPSSVGRTAIGWGMGIFLSVITCFVWFTVSTIVRVYKRQKAIKWE